LPCEPRRPDCPEEYESRRAALLLRALQHTKVNALEQFDNIVAQTPPPVNSPHLKAVVIGVQRAQLARVGAQAALEAALGAQHAIDAVPRDRTVTIDLRALHARNVLALPENAATREPKCQAHRFLEEHIARGYTFLNAFAKPAAPAQS